MPYQRLIIKLLRELEEDAVISVPGERSRAFFRKWVYKLRRRLGRYRRYPKRGVEHQDGPPNMLD